MLKNILVQQKMFRSFFQCESFPFTATAADGIISMETQNPYNLDKGLCYRQVCMVDETSKDIIILSEITEGFSTIDNEADFYIHRDGVKPELKQTWRSSSDEEAYGSGDSFRGFVNRVSSMDDRFQRHGTNGGLNVETLDQKTWIEDDWKTQVSDYQSQAMQHSSTNHLHQQQLPPCRFLNCPVTLEKPTDWRSVSATSTGTFIEAGKIKGIVNEVALPSIDTMILAQNQFSPSEPHQSRRKTDANHRFCQIVKANFSRRRVLYGSNGTKTSVCNLCKSFSNSSHSRGLKEFMRRHLFSHIKRNPHCCAVCSKCETTNPGKVRAHIKRRHPEVALNFVEQFVVNRIPEMDEQLSVLAKECYSIL